LLSGAGARADSGTAEARFAEGLSAFNAADFPTAQRLFEQSLELGLQSPAVHYNIGVAAYRGGDFARAERAFREVAKTPAMAALAHYNLGLVALKREDPRAARGWFELAAREADDEQVAGLAARRLEQLPRQASSAPWSMYARGGLGHDDNVALRSESLDIPGSGEDDTFAELLVAGSYAFLPSWRVDGAAGSTRYASLDEFDQSALSLGVARELSIGDWNVELGGHASQLSLGGDVYEQSAAASAHAARTYQQLGTLRAHVRLSSVDGKGEFAGLSGTRTNLGVQYESAWRSVGFVAHARAETNDADDAVFASRWFELGGEVRWAASPLWSFAADAALRRTRHRAEPAEDSYTDRRVAFRLEAMRTLGKQAQVSVRYERERNGSPNDAYDYERNWLAASIEIWR
jgi:tetratricopeptide (TPR) repeat protein